MKGEKRKFLLTTEDVATFFPKKTQEAMLEQFAGKDRKDLCEMLLERLSDPAWPKDEAFSELIRKPLTDMAFHYVTKEKNDRGNPLNPVANFHMSNGARVNLKS